MREKRIKQANKIIIIIIITRSYVALQAADLDWIVGPGYSSGRYFLALSSDCRRPSDFIPEFVHICCTSTTLILQRYDNLSVLETA